MASSGRMMMTEAVHPLSIGPVHLSTNLVLSPMAGVSDLPFRLLCREEGAGLVVSEMVSAKAILYHNRNTEALLQIDPGEHPVSLQIFGSDPDVMAEAVRRLEDCPFDILDINMGCPVPKIVKNGEGSALMRDPALVGRIVSSVVRASKRPVTVKIRAGFSDEEKNAPEIAHIIEESGASAVAVHGRTREQFYMGKADHEIIRKVKERVKTIPVFGNGDLASYPDLLSMYRETGCDGFLIGRAARGDPFVFSDILREAGGGEKVSHTFDEIRRMILRHADREIAFKGEEVGLRQMRKHAAWYMQGVRGASHFRGAVNEIKTREDLVRLLDEMGASLDKARR